jgi:hypothetical protein
MITEKFINAEIRGFSPSIKAYHLPIVWFSGRQRALYLFAELFTALSILLGIRLGEWDETEEGHCYITTRLSAPVSTHPEADKVYVGVSATYMIVALLMAVVGSATLVRTVLV